MISSLQVLTGVAGIMKLLLMTCHKIHLLGLAGFNSSVSYVLVIETYWRASGYKHKSKS